MNLPEPSPVAASSSRWLRWLPAPARWAPLLSRLPPRWTAHALEVSAGHALAAPLQQGELDFMQGRRLGIEVSDLGLHWVVEVRDGRLQVCPPGCEAEASVRGSATDLLALASRLEDADTLFFQRRLSLTGDTELGLTARNTLDRLSWEAIPLALRIVLNRCARVAVAARQAYHAERV